MSEYAKGRNRQVPALSVSKKSDHDRYRSASYGWTTLSARQSAADFAKSCGTYARTARFGVGVDAHIDPADCTVFTVICGEFATSRRADVGIGPYRVLREFTATHRADRGVRPYASLGNPTQNRKTIVFDRLRFPQPLCGLWEFFFLCVALTVSTIPRGKRKSISRLLTFPVPRATL